MSEKATLYFVVTKVIAPKNSIFNLIITVDNSKTIVKSPRSRSNAYTIPYKIMKEVSILPDKETKYFIEIIFFDNNQPIATGSACINPKNFLDVHNIELKQYDLNVPNMDDISVFVGVALIPIGKPFLTDYDIYGNSAKVVFLSDSTVNQSTSESNQANNPTQIEAKGVESESKNRYRRKKSTTDSESMSYSSQSSHSHKRHRNSISYHSSFDHKIEEEIVKSESIIHSHRKQDEKSAIFISEGANKHRRRRSHHINGIQSEIISQNHQSEHKSHKRHKEDIDQQKQEENQIKEQQNGNSDKKKRNENQNLEKIEDINNNLIKEKIENQEQHHRRHRRSKSQSQDQNENKQVKENENKGIESENDHIHLRKKGTKDSKSESSVSEEVHEHRKKKRNSTVDNAHHIQQQEEQQQQQPRRRHRKKTETEDKKEEEVAEIATTEQNSGNRKRRRKEKAEDRPNETDAVLTGE